MTTLGGYTRLISPGRPIRVPGRSCQISSLRVRYRRIVFHVFLSYFSWNHGHISRNFFTRTKVSSRLRRGKYDIQAQIAFFHTNQSLYVGIPYQRAAGEEKMSVCGLKITENGCLVCDFKGPDPGPRVYRPTIPSVIILPLQHRDLAPNERPQL